MLEQLVGCWLWEGKVAFRVSSWGEGDHAFWRAGIVFFFFFLFFLVVLLRVVSLACKDGGVGWHFQPEGWKFSKVASGYLTRARLMGTKESTGD